MIDITVKIAGQKYVVSGEGRDATVRVEMRRPYIGFRTLKHGSKDWRAAVERADYERALKRQGA